MDENKEYICPRCHYKTFFKSNFVKHLQRNAPCPEEFSSITVNTILAGLNIHQKLFTCATCNKKYSYSSGLSRHKKTHNKSENEKIIHTTLETSIVGDHNAITINMPIDNSTQMNINSLTLNILPFGKEVTEHIEDNKVLLDNCIRNLSSRGIPNIVEAIFFNEDLPQNQNVKLGREHHPPQMMVYMEEADGRLRWKSCDRHTVLHEMIKKGCSILVKYNNEIFCIDRIQDWTHDEKEIFDNRNEKLAKATSKARGVYGPLKSAILNVAQNKS